MAVLYLALLRLNPNCFLDYGSSFPSQSPIIFYVSPWGLIWRKPRFMLLLRMEMRVLKHLFSIPFISEFNSQI